MPSPVVQLRVPEDTLAAIDGARGDETRSGWILAVVERELLGGTAPETAPAASASAAPPAALAGVTAGEPSPGVVCTGPGCWARDTACYGLRKLPLCPACAAALTGEVYQRPNAARAGRVGKPAA